MFGDIRNQHGERIDYTFHAGAEDSDLIVLIGHGVTGNKDRPFVVSLAETLASKGFPTLRFSFAGNGQSEGRFQDATISKEVDDLGSVIDAVSGRRVVYVGHSMGGAVGVLRTSEDERIQFLVSLAGMVHTKQFAEIEFGGEVPDEGMMWEDPDCPLSSAYMEDLRGIKTLVDCGESIDVPWLLVHGSEDDVVPIGDSEDIIAKANDKAELLRIRGANHVFAEEHTATMAQAVVDWLTKVTK